MLDYATSEDPNDRFFVLSDFKSEVTDPTGIATFDSLSVMDC